MVGILCDRARGRLTVDGLLPHPDDVPLIESLRRGHAGTDFEVETRLRRIHATHECILSVVSKTVDRIALRRLLLFPGCKDQGYVILAGVAEIL
jgi:hypothetical protein